MPPKKSLVFAALFTVQVLFALNYVFSKFILMAIAPLAWASIRILISATLMVGVALSLKRPFPKGLKNFYLPLIPLALLGTVINQTSFLMGLKYTTATNSAVLTTLIPVFTLIFVTLMGKERATVSRVCGFMLAFGGVLVLRKIEAYKLSDNTVVGDLLTILNCASYGLFLALSKSFIERHDRFWTTAMLFVYGSFGITAVAMPDLTAMTMPEFTPILVFSMFFSIFGGTLISYFLNNWALAHAKSTHVAIFIYVQPVIAATFAYLLLGEAITTRTIASSLMIFCGVLLVVRGNQSNVRISKGWK